MTNKDKYNNIFIKSFNLDKSKLKKDIKYNSVPKWDSVGHMAMIAKLEETFKITMEIKIKVNLIGTLFNLNEYINAR